MSRDGNYELIYAQISWFVFLNEWQMAVNVFGALTREFCIVEIGTWEIYGGK